MQGSSAIARRRQWGYSMTPEMMAGFHAQECNGD